MPYYPARVDVEQDERVFRGRGVNHIGHRSDRNIHIALLVIFLLPPV